MKLEEEKNKDAIKMAWASLEAKVRKNKLGGGKDRLKKLEEKGKLSARKRINLLVDNPDEVLEIGVLAAENMYSEYGGCPSAGVVVVIGKVAGKSCVIVTNNITCGQPRHANEPSKLFVSIWLRFRWGLQ